MRAPRCRADVRLSSSRMPAPDDGTKPPAEALIGRDAFSGSWLCVRHVTLSESKLAHPYRECPSEPPASMRFARPDRTRWNDSTTASVPVLQALEFVET